MAVSNGKYWDLHFKVSSTSHRLCYLVFEGDRYFSWTARNLFRSDAYELGITFASWFVFREALSTSPYPTVDIKLCDIIIFWLWALINWTFILFTKSSIIICIIYRYLLYSLGWIRHHFPIKKKYVSLQ